MSETVAERPLVLRVIYVLACVYAVVGAVSLLTSVFTPSHALTNAAALVARSRWATYGYPAIWVGLAAAIEHGIRNHRGWTRPLIPAAIAFSAIAQVLNGTPWSAGYATRMLTISGTLALALYATAAPMDYYNSLKGDVLRENTRSVVRPGSALPMALVAAAFGMGSCWRSWGLVTHQPSPTPSGPQSMLVVFSPVIVGAIATALVYVVLDRIRGVVWTSEAGMVRSAMETNATGTVLTSRETVAARPRPEMPAAGVVFLTIAGMGALIGGLLAALIMSSGGDGAPPGSRAQAFSDGLSGFAAGAAIGGGLGLLLAIPAAMTVWIVSRKRRP